MAAHNVEDERLYRKQRLAVSFRLFAKFGFELGASRHITARDPEWPDRFWVNPVMHPFGEMRVSDLLLVAHDGTVIEGEGVANPAGFAIHSQLHAMRPDVVAAAHSHSIHSKAWSAFGRLIEPMTQDSAIFSEDLAIFDRFSGMVEDLEEGQAIGRALGTKNSVIFRNHGVLTTGASVESAVWRYVAGERLPGAASCRGSRRRRSYACRHRAAHPWAARIGHDGRLVVRALPAFHHSARTGSAELTVANHRPLRSGPADPGKRGL